MADGYHGDIDGYLSFFETTYVKVSIHKFSCFYQKVNDSMIFCRLAAVVQGVVDEMLFLNEFKTRCYDMECQNWRSELLDYSSLDVYRLFKVNLSVERYVTWAENFVYLSVLARFRCSQFNLAINTGRR